MSKYLRDSHCVYCCDYHIVFVPKYRRKVINEGLGTYLKNKAYELTKYYPKIRIKEFNYEKDHIHMFVSIPPQMSIGNFVRLFKTNSSRGIKQTFQFLKKSYWGTESFWSEGYFVSSVGISETIIRKYIKDQGEKDLGQTAKLFE